MLKTSTTTVVLFGPVITLLQAFGTYADLCYCKTLNLGVIGLLSTYHGMQQLPNTNSPVYGSISYWKNAKCVRRKPLHEQVSSYKIYKFAAIIKRIPCRGTKTIAFHSAAFLRDLDSRNRVRSISRVKCRLYPFMAKLAFQLNGGLSVRREAVPHTYILSSFCATTQVRQS